MSQSETHKKIIRSIQRMPGSYTGNEKADLAILKDLLEQESRQESHQEKEITVKICMIVASLVLLGIVMTLLDR